MDMKAKILVVDDEEIIRRGYVRNLANDRCDVAAAWNGVEALRLMENHPFDVVLLDLQMPEMDGMAVLRKIKDDWPESEVIVITGYPTVATAKEAVGLGAYDYLTKPLGPDEIAVAANGALMHKRWALHTEVQA